LANGLHIISSFNVAHSAGLLAIDATSQDSCDPPGGSFDSIHPATWVSESIFTAWSASVLVTALVFESDEPPPVSGYVAPTSDGVIAGVGFAF
jgi:hypothetical protein